MWEPPTVKRALPNRRSQWQLQRPLGCLALASGKGIIMRSPGMTFTVTITPASRNQHGSKSTHQASHCSSSFASRTHQLLWLASSHRPARSQRHLTRQLLWPASTYQQVRSQQHLTHSSSGSHRRTNAEETGKIPKTPCSLTASARIYRQDPSRTSFTCICRRVMGYQYRSFQGHQILSITAYTACLLAYLPVYSANRRTFVIVVLSMSIDIPRILKRSIFRSG
jgi:hypothetical protein